VRLRAWLADVQLSPRIRTINFPCARRVYVVISSMVTGFAFLSGLTQIAPPSTRFVFPGAGFRLGFPSHLASRRRSCLRSGVSTTSCSRGLSPPTDRPYRAYSRAALLRGTAGPASAAGSASGEARPAHAGPLPAGHTDHDGSILAAPSGMRSVSRPGRAFVPSAHPTTLTPVHPGCGDR
jgi:hypothetical protein